MTFGGDRAPLAATQGSQPQLVALLHGSPSGHRGIRAVLLDVDGTLYRQRPVRMAMAAEIMTNAVAAGSVRRLRHLIRIIGEFRRVREELRAAGAASEPLERLQFVETARRLGVAAADVEATVGEWMFRRPLTHLRRWKSPAIDAFLDVMRRHDLAVGALSDYPVADKLASLGVAHHFSLALCTTDPHINAFKPHPRGFLEACARWGLSPAEVLYVGDRPDVDASGARAAGMPCAIVGNVHSGFSRTGDVESGFSRTGYIKVRGFADLAAALSMV